MYLQKKRTLTDVLEEYKSDAESKSDIIRFTFPSYGSEKKY